MKNRRYLSAVVELGCIICGQQAEAHHILEGRYSQAKSSDREAIPLCPEHHRTGGHGVAVHAGPETWRSIHGSEAAFARVVRGILAPRFPEVAE